MLLCFSNDLIWSLAFQNKKTLKFYILLPSFALLECFLALLCPALEFFFLSCPKKITPMAGSILLSCLSLNTRIYTQLTLNTRQLVSHLS
jgi:hypothetical protein